MASGTVQIITDSTCALPPDTPAAVVEHIRVLRTSVEFGPERFLDGTLTLEQLYARVRAEKEHPHTSQPSPDTYLQLFQETGREGPVLVILLSSELSGTFNSGVVMAREVPDADIALFDSRFFSSALGYMVGEAAEMALAGVSRDAILEQLRWRRGHTGLYIAVDTLSYLQRSGRVNLFQAGIANALDIKPLLTARNGKLEVVGRVRSRRRSLKRLLALMEEYAATLDPPFWISAMHGQARGEAEWLLAEMCRRLQVERSFISEAPASVALHGGPGVVGVMVTAAGPGRHPG